MVLDERKASSGEMKYLGEVSFEWAARVLEGWLL